MSLSKMVQESKDKIKYDSINIWELGIFVSVNKANNILISSHISLLEAELERKEKTRRDENFYLRDAVSIVEEDITYLQEQIAEIRKLTN